MQLLKWAFLINHNTWLSNTEKKVWCGLGQLHEGGWLASKIFWRWVLGCETQLLPFLLTASQPSNELKSHALLLVLHKTSKRIILCCPSWPFPEVLDSSVAPGVVVGGGMVVYSEGRFFTLGWKQGSRCNTVWLVCTRSFGS